MDYEFVFGDLRPFTQCHAATVLRRPDAGLVVAWFGGTREGHRDTGIWFAERTGDGAASMTPSTDSHWTEPRILARVGEEPHWNPVLFALSENEYVLHFKVGTQIRSWTTWTQRSTDAGATWSKAQPLVPEGRGGRGAVKNKPIQLASGMWLAGASIETWRAWFAFVDRSPNGIDHWHASLVIPVERSRLRGRGIIQPTLWETPDGSVHLLARSTEGVLYRSESQDSGESWSVAKPTEIPNNNSGVDLVRLKTGILALACNPVGNRSSRSPLSVLFSRDNGETWPEWIEIEGGPGEYSYPALIEDGDGLCVAFTWNRRRIAVARIAADEIPK